MKKLFKINLVLSILILLFSCTNHPESVEKDDGFQSGNVAKQSTTIYQDSVNQITFGGQNTYSSFAGNDSVIFFNSFFKAWNTSSDQIFKTQIPAIKTDIAPQPISKENNTYSRPVYNAYTHTLLYAYSENVNLIKTEDFYISLPATTEIYTYDIQRKEEKRLTNNNFYDGDAVFSPDGEKIVCTSMKSGDLELWLLDKRGKYIKQLTHHKGFDGNANFSPDGKWIVYVSSTNDNIQEMEDLIKNNKVDPSYMELRIYDLESDSSYTLVNPGKASLHPIFTLNGKSIVFSSNYQSVNGLPFNLYITDFKGDNIDLVEEGGSINDYPSFSPQGKYLIFSSNRGNQIENGLNLFYKNWNNRTIY